MTTSIAIPNPVFEVSKSLAQELEISLGELYTLALKDYLKTFEKEKNITEQLNEIYKTEDSSIDRTLIEMQVRSIGGEGW